MPARLVVGIEHHFPCPLPHSQSDSTSSAIPYQLDAVDPRYLITDLHHVHEPIAFVAPERGLLRLAVAPSSPQNRVDPKRWWSDSGSTKMRVNHWTASLLSLLVCQCLACRYPRPHPACLGGASDFTLTGGARAGPPFSPPAAKRRAGRRSFFARCCRAESYAPPTQGGRGRNSLDCSDVRHV